MFYCGPYLVLLLNNFLFINPISDDSPFFILIEEIRPANVESILFAHMSRFIHLKASFTHGLG